LWGRHIRVSSATLIVHPGTTSGMIDELIIRGVTGLQTTRRATLHTVAYRWHSRSTGEPDQATFEALDPRESQPNSIGLLRDFCSQPTPEFRIRADREGYTSHEFVGRDLGPSGEISYFTGHIARNSDIAPGHAPGAEAALVYMVNTPTELLLL